MAIHGRVNGGWNAPGPEGSAPHSLSWDRALASTAGARYPGMYTGRLFGSSNLHRRKGERRSA